MTNRIVNTALNSELRGKSGRALIACGLWLRMGIIGACVLAVGLIQLFDGEVRLLTALATAVGGGLLAAFSWWRTWSILEEADTAAAVAARVLSDASARAAAGTPANAPSGGAFSRSGKDRVPMPQASRETSTGMACGLPARAPGIAMP